MGRRKAYLFFLFFNLFMLPKIVGISTYGIETGADNTSAYYLQQLVELMQAQEDVQYGIEPHDLLNPYEIQFPGTYMISDSVVTGNFDTNYFIKISSSNVVLELNGQQFIYDSSYNRKYPRSRSNPKHGIYIAPGLKNITIKNGTFIGFPGAGIKVAGNASETISGMTLIDMHTKDNLAGIDIEYTSDLSLKSCSSSKNNDINDSFGISVDNSSAVNIKECMSSSNSSELDSYGIIVKNSRDVLIEKTSSSSNTSTSGDTFGIHTENCSGTRIIECESSNNISFKGNSYGISFKDSLASFAGENKVLYNSSSIQDKNSYGIYLNNTTSTKIESNRVDSHNYGFFDTEIESKNLFIKNIAYENDTGYKVTFVTGELPLKTGMPYDLYVLAILKKY